MHKSSQQQSEWEDEDGGGNCLKSSDYEAQLTNQFKKLEQFWANKNASQYVSKCIFFLEAYGVNPSLKVGFEEAVFLASKMKSDLGGSLSTDKVLYLFYLTLLNRQEKGTKIVKGKDVQSEECTNDKDIKTFQAFIIRYLYFLREQRIVNQVQKMSSIEQVKKVFRSTVDNKHLQFHQIEAISSSECAVSDSKSVSASYSEFKDAGTYAAQTLPKSQASNTQRFSSKFNPELCSRNTHGQFVKRDQSDLALTRQPHSSDNQIQSEQADNSSSTEFKDRLDKRRQLKMYQKEAVSQTKIFQKEGILGKRPRGKLGSPNPLQDVQGQVFAQTTSGFSPDSQHKMTQKCALRKTQKKQKIGVSQIETNFCDQNQPSHTQNHTLEAHEALSVENDQIKSQYSSDCDNGQTPTSLWKVVSKKTYKLRPAMGLQGGNPNSQDNQESQKSAKQDAAPAASDQGARNQTASAAPPANPEDVVIYRPVRQSGSNQEVVDREHSHTMTDQSACVSAQVRQAADPNNSAAKPRRKPEKRPVSPFRMAAPESLRKPESSKASVCAKSDLPLPQKKSIEKRGAPQTSQLTPAKADAIDDKAFSAPAYDDLLSDGQNAALASNQNDLADASGIDLGTDQQQDKADESMDQSEEGSAASHSRKLSADGDDKSSEQLSNQEQIESESDRDMEEGEEEQHCDTEMVDEDAIDQEESDGDQKDDDQKEAKGQNEDQDHLPDKKEETLQKVASDDLGKVKTAHEAMEDDASSEGDKAVQEQQEAQANADETESEISSEEPGKVTKCYTVYKLQPRQSKNPEVSNRTKKTSPDKDNGDEANAAGVTKDGAVDKNESVKQQKAGIYQMLMQITNGIKVKPAQKSLSISPSKETSKSKASSAQAKAQQAKIQAKNEKKTKKETMDPQLALYFEQDMKVALSQQYQPIPKRRSRQNYLSYDDPFDLGVLLDNQYWTIKQSRLAHDADEICRLSNLNKYYQIGTFDGVLHEFLDFKEPVDSEKFTVKHLFWQNKIDSAIPYQSGFKEHFWNYIQENEIYNNNVRAYLQKAKRQSFCNCLDGCQNSRKCPCYKWNRKLQNPTYNKEMSPKSGSMIAIQQRAKSSINKIFTFNECHPRCACNKDMCQNYLIAAQNKKQFKYIIRRIRKTLNPIYQSVQDLQKDEVVQDKQLRGQVDENGDLKVLSLTEQHSNQPSSQGIISQRPKNISMWGLIAMEEMPAGAFLMEYLGEIVSKKQGDMRGTYYDANGLSYLFDLNDPSEEDEKEQIIQKVYNNEFFPLCLDSMFYGNEARFINHSCDPNVLSFNLTGQVDSNVYHSIGLFATRKIMPGEELTIDYQWDKNDLTISQDVPCLCGSVKCRGFLMRAKKTKKPQQSMTNLPSQVTSKQDEQSLSGMAKSIDTVSNPLPKASNGTLSNGNLGVKSPMQINKQNSEAVTVKNNIKVPEPAKDIKHKLPTPKTSKEDQIMADCEPIQAPSPVKSAPKIDLKAVRNNPSLSPERPQANVVVNSRPQEHIANVAKIQQAEAPTLQMINTSGNGGSNGMGSKGQDMPHQFTRFHQSQEIAIDKVPQQKQAPKLPTRPHTDVMTIFKTTQARQPLKQPNTTTFPNGNTSSQPPAAKQVPPHLPAPIVKQAPPHLPAPIVKQAPPILPTTPLPNASSLVKPAQQHQNSKPHLPTVSQTTMQISSSHVNPQNGHAKPMKPAMSMNVVQKAPATQTTFQMAKNIPVLPPASSIVKKVTQLANNAKDRRFKQVKNTGQGSAMMGPHGNPNKQW